VSTARPRRALLLVGVVLLGVPWSLKLFAHERLGESCEGGFDCAVLDGRCVRGEDGYFCTKVCSSDDECPSSGHCGVPVHDPARAAFSVSPLSETLCVPGPRPPE
jgi:hypothetical protein